MEYLMKPQMIIRSGDSDDYLQYLRQMAIKHVFVMFSNEHSNYDDVNHELERIRKAGFIVDDAGNAFLYKHPSIHLGMDDRDKWIEKYNDLNRIIGNAGVKSGYVGNSRVAHTGYFGSDITHGAPGRTIDMNEILKRPNLYDKVVEEEELWEHFNYLLKAAIPAAQEVGMRLALHPSDPPHPFYQGFASLTHNSDCYRRAFKMGDAIAPGVIGMKFCCGCWLEGGKAFGDILSDMREFVRDKRVLTVHFRNVSAPLPYCVETLCEDGYFDMTQIMRLLVEEGYDQGIYVDHIFETTEATGGMMAQFAYATGYMKGLMHQAYSEFTLKNK